MLVPLCMLFLIQQRKKSFSDIAQTDASVPFPNSISGFYELPNYFSNLILAKVHFINFIFGPVFEKCFSRQSWHELATLSFVMFFQLPSLLPSFGLLVGYSFRMPLSRLRGGLLWIYGPIINTLTPFHIS